MNSQAETQQLGDGDECPNCPTGVLYKPTASKPRCGECCYVVNSIKNDQELHQYDLTVRQGKRLLQATGHKTSGSAGDVETRIRRKLGMPSEINGLLADIRGEGGEW